MRREIEVIDWTYLIIWEIDLREGWIDIIIRVKDQRTRRRSLCSVITDGVRTRIKRREVLDLNLRIRRIIRIYGSKAKRGLIERRTIEW